MNTSSPPLSTLARIVGPKNFRRSGEMRIFRCPVLDRLLSASNWFLLHLINFNLDFPSKGSARAWDLPTIELKTSDSGDLSAFWESKT